MATTIEYPTDLPCPMTAGNVMEGGETFDRTEFDYATRQRARYCSSYMIRFNFWVSSPEQMKAFKDFYYTTLGRGAGSFLASWDAEGDLTQKEFRFARRYTARSVSGGNYSVQAEFEMLTKIEDL